MHVPEASEKQNATIHRLEVMLPDALLLQEKPGETAQAAHHMAFIAHIHTPNHPSSPHRHARTPGN